MAPEESYYRLKWTFRGEGIGAIEGKPYVFCLVQVKQGTSTFNMLIDPALEGNVREHVELRGWNGYLAPDGMYLGSRLLYRGGPVQARMLVLDTEEGEQVRSAITRAQRAVEAAAPFLNYVGTPALTGTASTMIGQAADIAKELVALAGDDTLAQGWEILIKPDGSVENGEWQTPKGQVSIRLDVEPVGTTEVVRIREVEEWIYGREGSIQTFVDANLRAKAIDVSDRGSFLALARPYVDVIRHLLSRVDRRSARTAAVRAIRKLLSDDDTDKVAKFRRYVPLFEEYITEIEEDALSGGESETGGANAGTTSGAETQDNALGTGKLGSMELGR